MDVNAIERVIDKRTERGATDSNLIGWLEHLKNTSWKNSPKITDEIKIKTKGVKK